MPNPANIPYVHHCNVDAGSWLGTKWLAHTKKTIAPQMIAKMFFILVKVLRETLKRDCVNLHNGFFRCRIDCDCGDIAEGDIFPHLNNDAAMKCF